MAACVRPRVQIGRIITKPRVLSGAWISGDMKVHRDANQTSVVVAAAPHTSATTWLLGLTALAVVLFALGGETVEHALRYERQAILDAGEYWRLLTGHFVHLSPRHMFLNLVGLALLALLFPHHYAFGGWATIAAASVLAIDAGFLWQQPQLEWYVGLSGVLHGALAAGAVAWWRQESKLLAGALSVILLGKLAWEQGFGALPWSADEPVVVAAHLYGAIGGALSGAGAQLLGRRSSRGGRPL